MIRVRKALKLILLWCCIGPVVVSSSLWAADKEGITLSLDNADIGDLVRWASDITDKNIILHPNVSGRITVVAGEPMDKKEAYEVFLSALQVHGLAIIEEGNSLKVIPDVQATRSPIPITDDGVLLSGEDTVIRVVKIKNISAANVINLLRPLVPQTGYLAAYPQTNTMIIADRASNIQKLLNIISRIDQAGTVEIELIPIEFADAREIIAVLTAVMPAQTGKRAQKSAPFNLAVDERSNSILTTGDPATRQQIRSLVKRLDQPLAGDGNTQVVRVQYATALDLVPLLQSISGSEQQSAKNPGIAGVDVSIQAHEQLNALVITAPPSILKTMRGVIKQLDVPRAQVLVEALIVEVSEDLANNIGIDWRTNPAGSGEGVVGGFRNFPQELTPFSLGADGSLNLGTGLSLGYFRDGNLRGIVNLLSGETNANILSTPTIVSLDNEEAEILVGSSVPFITGSQLREVDVGDVFQTIQREDIGVTLKVRPRINNNNSVTLDIEQTVESIAQSAVATADIITNKREIKTRVLIGDDEILVLGGLMRDEITDGENRVPILGSLPLIGNLFRSKSTAVNKTNLMVFIHPRILHNDSSLRDISRDKYNSIRGLQQQFDDNVERFWLPGESPLLPELPGSRTIPEPVTTP